MSLLDEEKRFYTRFWALHADPELEAIFRRFGPEPFRRSCVLEGLDALLRVERITGSLCLEIGTWKGLSAIVLARYFDEVHSIDLTYDDDRVEIAAAAGRKNIVFQTVGDEETKDKAIAGLDFDFAFIDGDHASRTWSDFALVERCGRVLFHEYWRAQPAVMDLVEGLQGTIDIRGKFALWRR